MPLGGTRRPRPHGGRCARPMCILALSGASEHAPGASHVSISNPRRDPGWRCHRGSSATRRGQAPTRSRPWRPTTRDPRRPKRFVVVSQGQRGHPATGSRPRTPSYKFTSTKLLPTYRPFCHAPGEPSVAATCKPGGRQGLAGAGRRRRALSACTSCIFDRIGQIAQPAGHRLGSAVWGVARLRGSVV